ncbi:MAG TPA: ABC transporter permease, partial [Actinomycetota bacterium]|nr:ABC transporter permease [Actinomycetota bacterium]
MSAASGVSAVAAPPRRPTGVRTAYRVEVAKISAQLLPRLTAVACIVGPFAFALFIHSQASVPADALFGRWLHTSGAAVPLVVLAFGAIIGFPLIASIVAG